MTPPFCCSAIRSTTAVLPFFFFNDTATTEIYTLSLHDALPISSAHWLIQIAHWSSEMSLSHRTSDSSALDRKSTRLNSSHQIISYAVFCLKKKKERTDQPTHACPFRRDVLPHQHITTSTRTLVR